MNGNRESGPGNREPKSGTESRPSEHSSNKPGTTDSDWKELARARDFKDLLAWQEAMNLITMTYDVVRGLPQHEEYALKSQMCRAAVSVAANIAEGNGSEHRGVYLRHLSISRGSLAELETYLFLMSRLHYAETETINRVTRQLQRVTMLLNALIRSLKETRKFEPRHKGEHQGTRTGIRELRNPEPRVPNRVSRVPDPKT